MTPLLTSHRSHLPLLTIPLWLRLLLSVSSGLLLALPYLYPQYYLTSWFGFVPLIIAVSGLGFARSYGLGLLAGIAFYLLAGYWVTNFISIFKGYPPAASFIMSLLVWAYCAQLPALLILSFQWCNRYCQPLLTFPALVVLFYGLFPMLFSGQLGESQNQFLWALQATSITGVYGLDFIIGLCNITLALLIITIVFRSKPLRLIQGWQLAVVVLVIGGWLGWGYWSYQTWESRIAQWPTEPVGLVQPNEAPSIGTPRTYPGYSRGYPPEMPMTQALAAAGAELVIWPEARFKAYFNLPHVRESYQHQLRETGVSLLFQDMEREPTPSHPELRNRYYNSATFINADGEQTGVYRKIKRIPFGEKLPLVHDIPGLGDWLKAYLGDFYKEILPGDKPAYFQHRQLKLVPLICYETLFPTFAGTAVANAGPGAVLVGLSSDAWFGRTHQPWLHLNTSTLRAVENRAPLVHLLNNGPSAVILPNGRHLITTPFDEAGGYLVDLPWSADSGGSFFSRFPAWFLITVCLWLALNLVYGLFHNYNSNRATRTS